LESILGGILGAILEAILASILGAIFGAIYEVPIRTYTRYEMSDVRCEM